MNSSQLDITIEGPGLARLTVPDAADMAKSKLSVTFPTSPATPTILPLEVFSAPNGKDLILILDADSISNTIETGTPYQLRIPELNITTTVLWPDIPGKRSHLRTVIDTSPPPSAPPKNATPSQTEPPPLPLPENSVLENSTQKEEEAAPLPSSPLSSTTSTLHQISSAPRRSWLLTGAFAVSLIVLAGAGAYIFFSPDQNTQPSPTPAADTTQKASVPAPPPVSPPPVPATPVTLEQFSAKEVIERAPNISAIGKEGLRRLHGQQKDDGILLLETAADHGDSPSMLELARLYDPVGFKEGGIIPTPDFRESARYYQRAVKTGNTQAIQPRAALHDFLEQESKKGNLSAQLALKDFWP